MQCNHCGKFVPSTSKTCMFCNQEIDPNARYAAPDENIGSIENTDYDTKLNIKVVNDYLKNPLNKKYVYMGVGIVVVFVLIFILLIMSAFSKKDSSSTVFINTFDKLYSYIDETLLTKDGHSGTASIELKVKNNSNDISYYATGDYAFDPLSKYYSYIGKFDGKYSSSDIKIDSKELPFNIILRDNNIYLTSEALGETVYSSDISLINDLLNLKGFEMDKMNDSVHDSLVYALEQMHYTRSNETINFRGKGVKTAKVSLELDNTGIYDFFYYFYTNLSESSKFLNQFSSLKNIEKEEAKTYLSDLLKTYEYKYNENFKDTLIISINYSDNIVYRINAIYNSNDSKKTYQLDIGDDAYYFDYFLNDNNVYSGTLKYSSKELTNKIHGEINVTFDSDSYITDLKIKYDDDKKASYKKKNYDEVVDISSISDEEHNQVKSKLEGYVKETYLLDKFRSIFKTECSSELECTCSDLTCRCEKDGKYITCPVKLIKK